MVIEPAPPSISVTLLTIVSSIVNEPEPSSISSFGISTSFIFILPAPDSILILSKV